MPGMGAGEPSGAGAAAASAEDACGSTGCLGTAGFFFSRLSRRFLRLARRAFSLFVGSISAAAVARAPGNKEFCRAPRPPLSVCTRRAQPVGGPRLPPCRRVQPVLYERGIPGTLSCVLVT